MLISHELSPIYDKNSKILILGSIPSVKSREAHFYYAHKNNRFWKIIEIIFNVKLNCQEEKIAFLHNNNIALWDVFKECEIFLSSDSSIKNYKLNDLSIILKNCKIKAIFCTGKKVYDTLAKNFDSSIPIIYLPSPSSANASYNLETLVTKYKIILSYLKKEEN
ncbi:MAG: DNA-deoxyinosine glycosylase [Bacilli bacterium]